MYVEHIFSLIHSAEFSIKSVGLKTWNPVKSLFLTIIMPLSVLGDFFLLLLKLKHYNSLQECELSFFGAWFGLVAFLNKEIKKYKYGRISTLQIFISSKIPGVILQRKCSAKLHFNMLGTRALHILFV